MLSLVRTSSEFRVAGYPASDVPFLIDDTDMSIVLVPSLWLVYIATVPGRTRRSNSWIAYGRDLLLWLRACLENGWDWRAVTESEIAQWRNHLLSSHSQRTAKRYARNTVVAYIRTVCAFYEWAYERKYIEHCPIRVKPSIRTQARGLLAHLGPTKNESERRVLVPPGDNERLPRFFTTDERRKLLAELGARDRLLARWGLYTGIRIHELAALHLDQIPDVKKYASGRYFAMTIIITKGGKTRSLWVPSFILDETHQYIRYVRRKALLDARRRGALPKEAALWLGRWGTALGSSRIRQRFIQARQAAGIATGHFHDLRHTYAITMLDQLLATSPDPKARSREPLKALKRLMGHRSISSTEIYLRAREEYLDDIEPDDLEVPAVVEQYAD